MRLYFQYRDQRRLDRPAVGWALFAVLIGWSWRARRIPGRATADPAWVIAGRRGRVLVLSHRVRRQSDQWWQPTNRGRPRCGPPTRPSPRRSCAGRSSAWSRRRRDGGKWASKGYFSIDVGRQRHHRHRARGGLAIGMAAQTRRRAHAELGGRRSARGIAGRARTVVPQVHDARLGTRLVARRGREIGGAHSMNGRIAGEQNGLRRLVSVGSSSLPPCLGVDRLVALLRVRRAIGVGEPAATPVPLETAVAPRWTPPGQRPRNVARTPDPTHTHSSCSRIWGLGWMRSASRDDGWAPGWTRTIKRSPRDASVSQKSIGGRMNWLGAARGLNTGPTRNGMGASDSETG